MKTVVRGLVALCVVVVLVGGFAMAFKSTQYYERSAVVVNSDSDIITFKDGAGNLWEAYQDETTSDLGYYDSVILKMDINGTPEFTDDTIVSIKKIK